MILTDDSSSFTEILMEWKNVIRIKFRNLILGIRNLNYWFRVVWNDRSWDGAYLDYMINHKLEKYLKFYSNPNNYHATEESRLRVLQYLKIAYELSNRVIKDDWATKEESEYVSRFRIYDVPCPDNPKLCELKFDDNGTTRERRAEIFAQWDKRRVKTRRLLYKILADRAMTWWD